MIELCEQLDELLYQAGGAEWTDLAARDIVYELVKRVRDLAYEVNRRTKPVSVPCPVDHPAATGDVAIPLDLIAAPVHQ